MFISTYLSPIFPNYCTYFLDMPDNLALVLGVALSVAVRVRAPLIGCCGVGVCVYHEMPVCHWLVRARDPHVTSVDLSVQYRENILHHTVIFSTISTQDCVLIIPLIFISKRQHILRCVLKFAPKVLSVLVRTEIRGTTYGGANFSMVLSVVPLSSV